MTASGRKRLWVTVAILAGLPLLLPLIALPGAKEQVLEALRAGLGRPIEAQSLHLHVYPVPGVELDQVRLGEDPVFGLEDMVVADSATANVRLGSLFSRRLSFSRIHLEGASINLVRNVRGEWNITALLDQAAHGGRASAPQVLAPSQRFPYLDWSNARINFKLEQTKQRFYLDQVEGSLARDSSGWRLQAEFQPERTDLNLSNTGEVTLDGRWPAVAAGFHQRPFAMELRLQDSYLAGSSALLAGHDVGVHGVVNAQMHVAGNGQKFNLSGVVQADSLRRWDLLPPDSRIRASFAGSYEPGSDRLQITGIGDPGFQHVRLQGEITNLFARPAADLHLDVQQAPAAWLLPLLLGVKAHVPANWQLSGMLQGAADLHWQGKLTGNGAMQLDNVAMSNGRVALAMQPAVLLWNGVNVRVAPAAARLTAGGQPSLALTVEGQASASGFEIGASGGRLKQSTVEDLVGLVGVASPWPKELEGLADAQLQWQASWRGARQAGWSGTLAWPIAVFNGAGAVVALRSLNIKLADSQPRLARFTAGVASADDAPAQVQATGMIPTAAPEPMARMLANTVWHGLLRGDLAGSISLGGPETARTLDQLHANGVFSIKRGALRTSLGLREFDQFEGTFQLEQGTLRLTHLVWRQGDEVYQGQGTADLDSDPGNFQLELKAGSARLQFSGPLRP